MQPQGRFPILVRSRRQIRMRWSFLLYLILIFGGLAYMAFVGLARG
jgi:uncharacterized protein (UPF0333 family)